MKVTLLVVGKTASAEIKNICSDYLKRINRYTKCEEVVIESVAQKITDKEKLKTKEGELILKKTASTDFLILLDDKGKEMTSPLFAQFIENQQNQSAKHLVFVVGGAYGFSAEVYARANAKLSLSKMTFSHQIVRAIFLEQLYRAYSILHGEPYHHE